MSANSTLFSDDSRFLPSNNSAPNFELRCLVFEPNSWVFTTFTVANTLLLFPLCVLVLHHGVRRWWQQRSCPIATATTNSDNVTYHLAVMEMLNVLGTVFCCCGIYTDDMKMLQVYYCFSSLAWYGETIFHVLTCVERYLAVVHPIAYLSLRKKSWIRTGNIGTGCIWLLCLGWTSLVAVGISTFTVDFSLLISSVIVISFCSLSALRSLVRPGPVQRGRDRERVGRSKRKAFYTIEAILGALLLRCIWNLVWSLNSLCHVNLNKCVWFLAAVWLNLPSSVVLPLLFLQRTAASACCRYG